MLKHSSIFLVAAVVGSLAMPIQAAESFMVSGSWSEVFGPGGEGAAGCTLSATLAGSALTITVPSAINPAGATGGPVVYVTNYNVSPATATIVSGDGCIDLKFTNLTLTVTSDVVAKTFSVVTSGVDDSGQVSLNLTASGKETGRVGPFPGGNGNSHSGTLSGILKLTFSLSDTSTYAAMRVTENSALLQGYILSDGGDRCTQYRFTYWVKGQTPLATDWTGPAPKGSFAGTGVKDLIPGTVYTFRLESRNRAGTTTNLPDVRTFTTIARITISAGRGGSVLVPGQGAYLGTLNSSLNVQAQANKFFKFASWSGSAVDAGLVKDPKAASTSVKLVGDTTLNANFDAVPSIVAYYPFNGNANEFYNPANNGVPFGANPADPNDKGPRFVSSMFTQAMALDGVDDGVEIPAVVSEDWTMAMWLKVNDPNADESPTSRPGAHPDFFYGYGLVNGDKGGNADDWGTAFEARALKFGVGKASTGPNMTLIAHDAIRDAEWHHVAFTRNATTGEIAIYVDGKIGTTKVADPNDPNVMKPAPAKMLAHAGVKNAMPLQIGAIKKTAGRYLNGQMDELYFFNYVLGDPNIADMAAILKAEKMTSIDVNDSMITALDGIPVAKLILPTITATGTPSNIANMANFSLDYGSFDNSPIADVRFAAPVTKVFIIERGANDNISIQALDSDGRLMGQKVDFASAGWLKPGFTIKDTAGASQSGGGMRVVAKCPIGGIRITMHPTKTGAGIGLDPASISGM